MELKGSFTNAKIFTENVDEATIGQVQSIIDNVISEGSIVRIMPDCHYGKGCVIGTTMTIQEKIVPNLVGVDIGCGVLCCQIPGIYSIPNNVLDFIIRQYVPTGFNIHQREVANFEDVKKLKCYDELNKTKIQKSLGTLGGGNHFIELSESNGDRYLTIHTGSRNLGKQVCDYYQKKAIENLNNKLELEREKILELPGQERENAFRNLREKDKLVDKSLAYLEGKDKEDYIHDMYIVQEYASINRKTICEIIIKQLGIGIENCEVFQTIHNYIGEDGILRKGAISAYEGEQVLIPINMKDGVIIGVGKGNPDWNYSAPHGAGRVLSRGQARKQVKLEEYEDSMKGIYSSCINKSTLDECPMAYKPMEEIIKNIGETVDIIEIIKPIFNYKAN